MTLRLGIDVGGTNTDAALLDDGVLVASHKATTDDVARSVAAAAAAVLAGGARPAAVTIGTTQFANAIVERKRLNRIAALRLCLPATTALPPLCDWPADLLAAVRPLTRMAGGGLEFDGRPIARLDEDAIAAFAREAGAAGITAFAVTAVFAALDSAMERRAAEIIAANCRRARVSLSHEIGRIGLLERENATALNAALADLAQSVVGGFRNAVAGLNVPLYLSQNDGTLMAADQALAYPVRTIASGPTNSMRGAALLSGLDDALVVDIGGTTADVGLLIAGYPREAATTVQLGGVRTNFRMPDVLSIGLGGGSRVHADGGFGPESVGGRLTIEAKVFGGETLTLTDIAVAAGLLDLGDKRHVDDLPAGLVDTVLENVRARLDDALDRVRPSAGALPVVLVGGGAVLAARPLAVAASVHRPAHAGVANAVGAALAEVGGECERVFSLEQTSRGAARAEAEREAAERAVAAGADAGSVRIADVEELPLTYMPGNATRFRVKAIGRPRT